MSTMIEKKLIFLEALRRKKEIQINPRKVFINLELNILAIQNVAKEMMITNILNKI